MTLERAKQIIQENLGDKYGVEFSLTTANIQQQVRADEIDNMPEACKKCGNRGYDVCPTVNCQFHSLT